MENQIITNERHEQALELHKKIITSAELTASYLVDTCINLKKMRDEKLYEDLDYSSFDEYVENMTPFKSRQAYNYIKTYETHGSTFLQSNAKFGITKLTLLSEISDVERGDFIEKNDVEGMSVKEIKALIEKSKEQTEQIGFLTQKSNALERDLLDERLKPIDVAVEQLSDKEIEKIKSDARNEISAKLATENAEALKKAKSDLSSDFDKKKEEIIEQVKKETEKEVTEKLQTTLAQVSAEKSALLEKSQKLAKKLEMQGDANIVKIMCYFNSFQVDFANILKSFEELQSENAPKASELKKAVMRYVETVIIEKLRGM